MDDKKLKIKEYVLVRMKDGLEGAIVHICEPGVAYYLDYGSGTDDDPWDCKFIFHDEIDEVIEST